VGSRIKATSSAARHTAAQNLAIAAERVRAEAEAAREAADRAAADLEAAEAEREAAVSVANGLRAALEAVGRVRGGPARKGRSAEAPADS